MQAQDVGFMRFSRRFGHVRTTMKTIAILVFQQPSFSILTENGRKKIYGILRSVPVEAAAGQKKGVPSGTPDKKPVRIIP